MFGLENLFSLKGTIASDSNMDRDDILKTKKALNQVGHFPVPDWGLTDFAEPAMIDGLKSFQKANGLEVDGVMKPGGPTETALNQQLSKATTPTTPNLPKPAATPEPIKAPTVPNPMAAPKPQTATGLPKDMGKLFAQAAQIRATPPAAPKPTPPTSLPPDAISILPTLSDEAISANRRMVDASLKTTNHGPQSDLWKRTLRDYGSQARAEYADFMEQLQGRNAETAQSFRAAMGLKPDTPKLPPALGAHDQPLAKAEQPPLPQAAPQGFSHDMADEMRGVRAQSEELFQQKYDQRLRQAFEAYETQLRGGHEAWSPDFSGPAMNPSPEHKRSAQQRADSTLDGYETAAKADWQKDLGKSLTEQGLPEPAADLTVLLASVIPVTSAGGAGLDTLQRVTLALQEGRTKDVAKELARGGVSLIKVGKIEKQLEGIALKYGPKALGRVAQAMPETATRVMTRMVGKSNLDGEAILNIAYRHLKDGRSPVEAITFGVLETNFKRVVKATGPAVFQATLKDPAKRTLIIDQVKREALDGSNLSLLGVGDELLDRWAEKVVNDYTNAFGHQIK